MDCLFEIKVFLFHNIGFNFINRRGIISPSFISKVLQISLEMSGAVLLLRKGHTNLCFPYAVSLCASIP